MFLYLHHSMESVHISPLLNDNSTGLNATQAALYNHSQPESLGHPESRATFGRAIFILKSSKVRRCSYNPR